MEGKTEPIGASSAHQASSSCSISVEVTVSEGNQAGASNFLRFGTSGSAVTEVDPSRLRLFNNDWPSLKMA
jgi:uridine phosphorylase